MSKTAVSHDRRIRHSRSSPGARAAEFLNASRLAWVALGVMLAATAVLLYRETRGTTLWFDEWTWALTRRGSSLDSFLAPHNGHLSLVPIAIYKLLFATAGIGDYRPYRVLVIGGHLLVATLVFLYARARVGGFLGLVATALILFFGPGWQNFIWPFQIGWLLSLSTGMAALMLREREDRGSTLAACGLIAVSLASSGIGVPIAAGLVADALVRRRGRRDAWVLGIPIALYLLWSIHYQHTAIERHAVVAAPGFVADEVASALAALAGLGGQISMAVPTSSGTLLEWGPPLAVATVLAMVWRMARWPVARRRALAPLTMAGAFWLLTALTRSFIGEPFSSRYLYVGAVFVLLAALALAHGLSLRASHQLIVGVLAAGAVASNLGLLGSASRYVRAQGAQTAAALAAFELTRGAVDPGFVEGSFPGYPLVVLRAGQYFALERALGSPAASLATLPAYPEDARQVADASLIAINRVTPEATAQRPPTGTRPAVEWASGGALTRRGGCVSLTAQAVSAPGTPSPTLALILPRTGVVVTAVGGQVGLGARRFADRPTPIGTIAAGTGALVRPQPDRAPQPWHLWVSPGALATVCGLRG